MPTRHGVYGRCVQRVTRSFAVNYAERQECEASNRLFPAWLCGVQRRRGWDSNPRSSSLGCFQDSCLQPLGHLSINDRHDPDPGSLGNIEFYHQDVLASFDATAGEYQTPERVVHCATIALRAWAP